MRCGLTAGGRSVYSPIPGLRSGPSSTTSTPSRQPRPSPNAHDRTLPGSAQAQGQAAAKRQLQGLLAGVVPGSPAGPSQARAAQQGSPQARPLSARHVPGAISSPTIRPLSALPSQVCGGVSSRLQPEIQTDEFRCWCVGVTCVGQPSTSIAAPISKIVCLARCLHTAGEISYASGHCRRLCAPRCPEQSCPMCTHNHCLSVVLLRVQGSSSMYRLAPEPSSHSCQQVTFCWVKF